MKRYIWPLLAVALSLVAPLAADTIDAPMIKRTLEAASPGSSRILVVGGNPSGTGALAIEWVDGANMAQTIKVVDVNDVTGGGPSAVVSLQDIVDVVNTGGGGGTDDQVASEVPFTPYLTLASNNVQAAIQEMLDEFVAGSDNLGDHTATQDIVLGPYNITLTSGLVDGRDIAVDGAKLDGIEAAATADQTGAEIKTAYELEANTNAFTDAEQTKLAGVETAATADQTAAEVVFTPSGTLAATDVDAALQELDGDVQAISLADPPYDDLAGGTVLTLGAHHSDTLAVNRTYTFTGTPVDGQETRLALNITATSTVTFPSATRVGTDDGAITSLLFTVASPEDHFLTFIYDGAAYWLIDSQSGAGGTGDILADGSVPFTGLQDFDAGAEIAASQWLHFGDTNHGIRRFSATLEFMTNNNQDLTLWTDNLEMDGMYTGLEQSAIPHAMGAGEGGWYVKNTNPTTLVFVDSNNAETTLGATTGAPAQNKELTVANPTITDDLTWFYTPTAITITELATVIRAGTSVTPDVRHGTDRSAAGTPLIAIPAAATSTTTGAPITTFDNPTIAANSYVWVEYGGVDGAVEEATHTLSYVESAGGSLAAAHGSIHITTPLTNTANGTPTLLAGAGVTETNILEGFTHETPNRLTYRGIATRVFKISMAATCTHSAGNTVVTMSFAENGVNIAGSEISRKVGTGGDVGAIALEWIVSLDTNDYIEVFSDADSAGTTTISKGVLNITGL